MPSRRKTVMFGSAFLTCLCSFVVICVVLATQRWMSSEVHFSGTSTNVTISLTYGLFRGTCKQFLGAGLQVPEKTFQVTDNLSNTKAKRTIIAIIAFLVLGLLSSLLSSGFTCTNAVSNPYETFLGPTGVYTWNSLCGIFILIAMILFPVNIEVNSLSTELARGCSSSPLQTHISSEHVYGYSYWIMLLIVFLNIASIIIIYFYDHARYSKKKEQERPIENAPKDVILF
ncbi:Clarin-3 [Tauraco erythrolophus]|uniref:Clarin-3 n=1 Tax=Tauraco erythrolophus TaxID=121530 RepID=A0A093D4Y8_TAUER|nr:PREDICTED: clarin-3 [Tauraco erythrolophus]KFV20134.1 Clarin-3 [Tauraco erythrolophus]